MARVLLGAYLLFLVYGSFFPFELSTDPAAIRENLAVAVFSPYDRDGHRAFSLGDLASNVILGVPFGLLLVTGGWAGTSARSRLLRSGLLDLVLAAAVEAGQLLAPGRITSLVDVAGQVGGSLAGALAGHVVLGAGLGGLSARLLTELRRRPLLAPLAALLGVLAADALYPYAFTLDPSTVWDNVKHSNWRLGTGLHTQPWHALLVDRVLPYAAVAGLARLALAPSSPARLAAIWGLTGVFATSLEGAKLFVEGRSLQMGHVALAAGGALIGLAAAPPTAPLAGAGRRLVLPLAGALLIAYQELRPFDFTLARDVVRANAARIEWAPFASYLMADPQSALSDAGKKLLLGALFGLLLRAAGSRAPALWAVALAALLEGAQLFTRSHQSSITDVGLLAGGAWLGAALLARYRAVLDSR